MDQKAFNHLRLDKTLSPLLDSFVVTPPRASLTPFRDLVEAIINQQLSSKAAATITSRFLALCSDKEPTPSDILSLSAEDLRSAGLSRQKISYLHSLADEVASGRLVLSSLSKLSDEEVVNALVRVKGVGHWTAEMFLLFSLARPDIFSVGDLGLCTAVSRLYGVDRKDKDAILEIASFWQPYRSLASLYLWRSLSNS